MKWLMLFALVFTGFMAPVAAQPAVSADGLARRGERAGADPELIQAVRDRATEQGLAEADVARLLQPAVQLAEADLPSRQVLRKAIEGLAKRVPPGRVAGVLANMEQNTRHAGTMIDPWMNRERAALRLGPVAERNTVRFRLIESIAQALTQDVPEGTVQVLLKALPGRGKRNGMTASELETIFAVVTDLPASSDDPAASAELVLSAIEAGYDQADLRRLPSAVREAQRRGNVPGHVIARQTANQIRGGQRAADVLGGLFEGGLPPGQRNKEVPPGLSREERGGPPSDPGNSGGKGNKPPKNNPGNSQGNSGGAPGQGQGN